MSTNDNTHTCPAPGCQRRVEFDLLACSTHWYSIPSPLRRELWRTYRDNFGGPEYFAARDACLRALGAEVAESSLAPEPTK